MTSVPQQIYPNSKWLDPSQEPPFSFDLRSSTRYTSNTPPYNTGIWLLRYTSNHTSLLPSMCLASNPVADHFPTERIPRLKLTMPSPTHAANLHRLATSPQDWEQSVQQGVPQDVEQHMLTDGPLRPSYSPVTPTLQDGIGDGDAQKPSQTELIDEPESIPIKLEENSDAIALQAALSILQLQKQQSQRDIKQLNQMKATARQDPEAFVESLKAGALKKTPPRAVLDSEDEVDPGEDRPEGDTRSRFGKFPEPLNVVRTPPINWAKYHIVGESLDKLHNEQRKRPDLGRPREDQDRGPPEYVVAAPYRPFVDKIDPGPSSAQIDGGRAEFKN